ncbi:hypothetical protein SRHO_G00198040 [Serrasalmus rhombeus]
MNKIYKNKMDRQQPVRSFLSLGTAGASITASRAGMALHSSRLSAILACCIPINPERPGTGHREHFRSHLAHYCAPVLPQGANLTPTGHWALMLFKHEEKVSSCPGGQSQALEGMSKDHTS